MRLTATRCFWSLTILLLTAVFTSAGTPAAAQVNPLWDHYKVYNLEPKPSDGRPVFLQDQFTEYTHIVELLDFFANPTVKMVSDGTRYPINDSLLHYTWWRITPQPHSALVAARNQFGDQTLTVTQARYLLNPALKNAPAGQEPPLRNHYKCYDCQGNNVNQVVTLTDQFDTWQTAAIEPVFFCNPTLKQDGAVVYPIQDPAQHYVCYRLSPPDPGIFPARVRDQFVPDWQAELSPGIMLCVPTEKTGVTSTRTDTWGRMKLLYR